MNDYIRYSIKSKTLKSIADVIRNKLKISNEINPDDYPSNIENILTVSELFDNIKKPKLSEITILSENIPPYALFRHSELKKVNIPNAITIESNAFAGTNVSKLMMPKVKSIHDNGLFTYVLTIVDAYQLEYIGGNGITGNLLETIVIRTNKVCKITSGNSISKTVNRIYVRDELVEQYKKETNWVIFADKIEPLSNYIEE